MAPFFLMLKPHSNIFLVGLMAVGKSTVGKYLAKELKLEFYDSDRTIEQFAGADISWIFDVEGETGFRDREAQVIDELTQKRGIVLATGGGVILREENRRHLAARGIVVYLVSPLNRLVERTHGDKRRPLLRDSNAIDVFQKLQNERGPLYREISDHEFSAEQRSPRTLARSIAAALMKQEA